MGIWTLKGKSIMTVCLKVLVFLLATGHKQIGDSGGTD